MMLENVHNSTEKLGSLTVTTLEGDTMHSRIINICGSDDDGIYLLTMYVKPFYPQLIKKSRGGLVWHLPLKSQKREKCCGSTVIRSGFHPAYFRRGS